MISGHRTDCSALARQAQGMVSVQAGCTLPNALLRMQSSAVDAHEDIDDIAQAVVGGRMRFGDSPN